MAKAKSVPEKVVIPPKKEAEEEIGETVPVDKAQAVLDELKAKSREIVVRGLFTAPLYTVTAESVRIRLTDAVGIDGWGQEYKLFKDEPGLCILCALHVRIAGEWVYKQGLGTAETGVGTNVQRIKQAAEAAFLAAAREFGIGSSVLPERPVAAAAKGEPAKAAPTAAAPPSGNGKKTDVKVDPKVDQLNKFWSVKLTECENPDDLNAMLRGNGIKNVPREYKRAVFNHIQAEAKTLGWEYDTSSLLFFLPPTEAEQDPVDATEGMPF